jgi:MoaA/NifB/PqqE/SkfB family radical SAM enzyme
LLTWESVMKPHCQKNDAPGIICLSPFYALELNLKGDVSVCCPAWGRKMVGNVGKKSLSEIWNDRPIRYVRRMMLEGKWEKICRPTCPVIVNHRLHGASIDPDGSAPSVMSEAGWKDVQQGKVELSAGPTRISFANSRTCNIDCVMCGGRYFREDRTLVEKATREVKALLPGLKEVLLTGHGDPFARQDTRDFLLALDPAAYPGLRINLLTNGLLLPRYWDRIKHLNFGYIDVSVDAATKGTYEKIRSGGRWEELQRALETLHGDRDSCRHMNINMTVMRDNFREVPLFVEMAARYGFSASLSSIRGRWGDQNIFSPPDGAALGELRFLVAEALQRAESLGVQLNVAALLPFLQSEELPWSRQLQQRLVDNAKYWSYRMRAFAEKLGRPQ